MEIYSLENILIYRKFVETKIHEKNISVCR